MIEEYLSLRNKVHPQDFRFNFTLSLWRNHYTSEDKIAKNVEEIREDGALRGYAVFEELSTEQNKICMIRELCADGEDTFAKLIERVINRCVEEDFDFIVWRQCEEPYDDLLNRKGFLTTKESVIMMKLLNPRDLLLSLSSPTNHGKVMKLNIREFASVTVKVGEKSLSVLEEDEQPQFTISTDARTFIRLMFGKASFWKEFFKRKVRVRILHLWTAKHFFDLIKNKGWYIPSGDWC